MKAHSKLTDTFGDEHDELDDWSETPWEAHRKRSIGKQEKLSRLHKRGWISLYRKRRKDADVAHDELAAQWKSLMKRQSEAKDAVQKAREMADRLKPACIEAMNKYWDESKASRTDWKGLSNWQRCFYNQEQWSMGRWCIWESKKGQTTLECGREDLYHRILTTCLKLASAIRLS